eukprot:COSAG03_NODE_199_length_10789_cov_369.743312_9_plen_330_part_00
MNFLQQRRAGLAEEGQALAGAFFLGGGGALARNCGPEAVPGACGEGRMAAAGGGDEKEWLVWRILEDREKDGEREYLVHWKGFPEGKATWEPAEYVEECAALDAWEAQGATGTADPAGRAEHGDAAAATQLESFIAMGFTEARVRATQQAGDGTDDTVADYLTRSDGPVCASNANWLATGLKIGISKNDDRSEVSNTYVPPDRNINSGGDTCILKTPASAPSRRQPPSGDTRHWTGLAPRAVTDATNKTLSAQCRDRPAPAPVPSCLIHFCCHTFTFTRAGATRGSFVESNEGRLTEGAVCVCGRDDGDVDAGPADCVKRSEDPHNCGP